MKITPQEFINHWVKDKQSMSIVSRFEQNIFDFTTKAGEYTAACFRESFTQGGFYGSGTKWLPRSSRWGKLHTHPTMIDTETLKKNIKGSQRHFDRTNITGRRANGTRIFKRGSKYDIDTEETSKASGTKRGNNPRGKGYAAIHNTDPRLSGFTVNQHSSKKPVHRQFIGYSPKIDSHIAANFMDMIFKGFPTE